MQQQWARMKTVWNPNADDQFQYLPRQYSLFTSSFCTCKTVTSGEVSPAACALADSRAKTTTRVKKVKGKGKFTPVHS
jgi:hypothetical protein